MIEVATIAFREMESSEDAVFIVRRDKDRVSLCVSLLSDGDIEVMLDHATTRNLIAALQSSVENR
jgi:hypothetical protein